MLHLPNLQNIELALGFYDLLEFLISVLESDYNGSITIFNWSERQFVNYSVLFIEKKLKAKTPIITKDDSLEPQETVKL